MTHDSIRSTGISRLTRTGSPVNTFDAQAVVNDVNHFANVQLQVGDVVFIPSASSKTYVVLGEVVKPGINPLSKDRPTHITDALAAAGLTPEVAEVTMRPENTVELSDADIERMQKLLDMLEDLDDVQEVYHNAVL